MNGTPPPPISFGWPRAHSPSPLARSFRRRMASAAASSSRASTGSAGTTSSSMKPRTRSPSARTSGGSPYGDMGDPPPDGYTPTRSASARPRPLPEAIGVGLGRGVGRVDPRAEPDADPLRRVGEDLEHVLHRGPDGNRAEAERSPPQLQVGEGEQVVD